MSKEDFLPRPAKIVLAVKMLYLVVSIGILRALITVVVHADVRSPFFLILVKLCIYSLSVFLIYQLWSRKVWAKWPLIAIFIICIPLVVLPLFNSFSHSPANSLLGLLQLVLFSYSIVLIFCKESSAWFKCEQEHGGPP